LLRSKTQWKDFISLKATAKFVVQIPVAVGILHVFSAAFFSTGEM
jgi:hypothetical protein